MATSPTRAESAPSPGRLIVISGASGSGKSTLVDRLLFLPGLRLRRSISWTTRDPRPGEVDGVDYVFVDRPSFEALRHEDGFIETAEVHGHLYGTPLGPIVKARVEGLDVVLVIDVQGAMQVRGEVPDALLIFLHAPNPETLEARLRARGTDDEPTIARRLANAQGEVALADRYDFQVVNDDLDRAVEEIAGILTRNRPQG